MSAKKSNAVELNVRGHAVTITNGNIVHVHHKKNCLTPCKELQSVLNYLEAELFVQEGYITSEVVEDD